MLSKFSFLAGLLLMSACSQLDSSMPSKALFWEHIAIPGHSAVAVSNLAMSHDGRIWAFLNDGLSIVNGTQSGYIPYPHDLVAFSLDGFQQDNNAYFFETDSSLWLRQGNNFFHLLDTVWSTFQLPGIFYFDFNDFTGQLFVINSNGIYQYQNNIFQSINFPQPSSGDPNDPFTPNYMWLSGDSVFVDYEDYPNGLTPNYVYFYWGGNEWIPTQSNGPQPRSSFFEWDGNGWSSNGIASAVSLDVTQPSWSTANIEGQWEALKAGLSFDDVNNNVIMFTNSDTQGGLPSDSVNAIVIDNRAIKWVATQSGLATLNWHP